MWRRGAWGTGVSSMFNRRERPMSRNSKEQSERKTCS